MPFFSIIIPTYNRAGFLPVAIESVLQQTFLDWELIVIDDGSTDSTQAVVTQYVQQDSRINYYYQENAERSAARNHGISRARGEWICFLDSDDEYLPEHLMSFSKAIEYDSKKRLILSGHLIYSNNALIQHPLLDTNRNLIEEISSKFILMNSVCVSKEILADNRFNEEYRIWEDTHLWLRIASQFPVEQLETYSCKQLVSEDSTVLTGLNRVKIKDVNQYIKAIIDLQTNHFNKFNQLVKTDFFINYAAQKLNMYLYQARQNQQLFVSLQIWLKAILHQPSFYLLSEFPKIFMNKINIGIHAGK